jgi:RNA polymerase sigma-70 factor (ECF subfamily)
LASAKGDDRTELLRELMEAYQRDVFHVLLGYVKDRHIAEDLAQDVFVKVYDHLGSFRQESSYRTWIMRIAINRAKDFLRSFAHKTIPIEDVSQWDSEYSVEQTVMSHARDEYLWKAVTDLPELYREVMWLYYAKEMTIEEISQILELNQSAVKTRMFRGRELLKKAWQGGGEHDARG